MSSQVQVQTITRRKAKRGSDLCWNHKSTLLAKH